MSQTTSHIFDQNNSHKRATIGNVYASTPIKPLTKLHSISLSGIDTFSSSSGGRNSQFIQSQIQTKKHKRYTKGKKKGSKNWHVIETDSEYEVKAQKKTLKNKKEKRTVKRKRIIIQSDSEWETESEKLINEPSINTQESILNNHECIQLFEDVYNCTPEKTRDIPNTYEENLHVSPIIESSIRMRLTSKKNDMQDDLLPVNLLSTDTRTLEETDEAEMRFRMNFI
ncbi:uncharacterized protein LOC105432047 [Pogonomyrmex barbatus]|uniref:Uncharacterized protein LOC105432047 n=1 Tax=Pogonomyrmex barbatus TaxID=144034 RepID=A0A6I9WN79_9HYME|nr:uncharacterized protein LOC105432047 [Pogonomyrmex barbatus]